MKGNVIDLFMWGYQHYFQISIQNTADSLFNEIDKRLQPKVFVIGVLVDEREDRHPICLEPEECGYKKEAFAEVKELAKHLEKVDAERNIIHSHPSAQQSHDTRIGNRALIEGLSKILNKEDVYGETEKFISFPYYVEGYQVFTVLEINKKALNRHYSLKKERFSDRYKISRSFIESTIDTFLKESTNALKEPNKAIGYVERNIDELLQESAKHFMYSISNVGENFNGLHGLFEACNSISSLKYEGAEGLGKLLIAKKDHSNVKLTLQLEKPINIRDFRKVRKFLELSNDDTLIISDSSLIYGLGELRGHYNPSEESLFIIEFTKHYHWDVLHDNNPLLSIAYRIPSLPKDKVDKDKFYSDFHRVFSGISKDQVDQLWDVTIEATYQKHGTMLVITDIAKKEAKRLGNQSFRVKPFKLNKDIVNQVTSIDGCVLLDRDSTCHSIGVILDGIATSKGNSGRGARYNSAIRYYEYKGKKNSTIIVIVSEDGMINLIPDLMPRIKHSIIKESIDQFKALLSKDDLDRKSFNQGMSFFKSINFYLTQEECDIVNNLRKEIEQKFEGELEQLRIVYDDLQPDPEMDKSFYLNE